MKNLLFAALSLVSGFSKDQEHSDIKNLEIQKNNEFIISGEYAKVNNFYGINVTNTGTEDYFYSFSLDDFGKVYKSGHEITFSDLREGDKLKITYDGSVSLVYPPKLNHVTKVEVVDN
jgi:hypothetical protein